MKSAALPYGLIFLVFLFAACGGAADDGQPPATQADGLSQAELENGIGPIKSVALEAEIDEALAERGEVIFASKCTACHKMEERYVGPPLGQVLAQRTPAYVMNMMLNPDEMVQKHPEAKALLAQYFTPMPNQNLTEDDARAVLEYLRAHQSETEDDETE